jgi:hypothetical protein
MMSAADADHLLKTLYPKKTSQIVYEEHPLLSMLPKSTDFDGRNRVIDVIFAETSGRSATFANANTNAGSHKGLNFTVTTVADYAKVIIPRKLMKQAGSNKGAIVDLFQTEVDSGFRALSNSMAASAFGDGSGTIGAVGSVASNVVNLSNASNVVNFDVGQVIIAASAKSGGTLRTGTMAVTAVDRDAGTVTFGGGTVASLTAGDFLFMDGDRGAKMTGLDGWLPSAAPSSGESFFGTDRSKDASRLGGIRVDGSTLNHEEALIKAVTRLARERGPKPDYFFMNPEDVGALIQILGSKREYSDVEATDSEGKGTGIGFRALVVHTAKGDVKVLGDADCAKSTAYGLVMNTWKLDSTGEAPEIFEDDGLRMIRSASADAYEVQLGYYAQIWCNAPGYNVRLALPVI